MNPTDSRLFRIDNRFMKRMPIQIRFTDIDIFGHINNARYPELFDTSRYLYLNDLISDFDPQGKSMVLVHLETNFRKQIVFEDRVFVETRVEKVGERSIGMRQYIINEKDGAIHADSYGILSTYDAVLQQSFPMPEAWRRRFEAAKSEDENPQKH
ncbi:MAG: acyl-CoA thioesterase [Lentimicrobiaceae bacterium]|nr:acyl-CoA thioesterase [Lentimicrobiaceae bacterium]